MEQTLNLTINRLPALTWHHLGMNQTSLKQVLAEGEGTLTIETPDGVTQPAQDDLPAIGGGMGPDMDTLVQAAGVPVHHLNVSAGTAASQPVRVRLTYGPEEKKINAFTIHAEADTVENNPLDPSAGTREVAFSGSLWIEADDFMAEPIPKYKRLTPNGPECRLKGAYLITCTGCVKDENGNVTEVLATYDPDSRGGDPADGRKVKGATIHWVDAATAVDAEVRLYDNLFTDANPDAADKDFIECLNPGSLEVLTDCKIEAGLAAAADRYAESHEGGKTAPGYQFMRLGYFCLDNKDTKAGHPVFNRSVSLKDSFKK